MLRDLNHNRLLRIAGLFTWAVIGLPLLMLSLAQVEQLTGGARMGLAWIAWAVFGLSYAWLTRGLGERRIRAFDHLLVLLLAQWWLSSQAIERLLENQFLDQLQQDSEVLLACLVCWLYHLPLKVPASWVNWLVQQSYLPGSSLPV